MNVRAKISSKGQLVLEAYRLGIDLADAFHLLSVEKSDELLTFDDDFEKRPKRMNHMIPVRIPQLTA